MLIVGNYYLLAYTESIETMLSELNSVYDVLEKI